MDSDIHGTMRTDMEVHTVLCEVNLPILYCSPFHSTFPFPAVFTERLEVNDFPSIRFRSMSTNSVSVTLVATPVAPS
jgi:hypothetical protein